MGRQLTQEEVLAVLEPMHPTIDFSEFVYVNSRTRVRVSCKTCNYRWQPKYDNLRQGHGCLRCSGRAKLTQEEALKAMKSKHPTINFGEFVYGGTRAKVRVSCKTCNHKWQPRYNCLQQGSGCPKCAGKVIPTQEEALANLRPKHPTIDFSEFIYKGACERVRVSCKTCNHKWEPTCDSLRQGHGCPKCAGTAKLTQEEALAALKSKHPTIDFSEFIYKGSCERVRVSCKTCNRRWEPAYTTLQKGRGCPKCAGTAKLTQEEALAVLRPKHPTIDFSEFIYKGLSERVRVSCKTCNHVWNPMPKLLKKGSGCPRCKASHGEKRVSEILDGRGLSYETEATLKGTSLRFDFFIPSLRIAIEVQGEQHYFAVDYFGGIKAFRKNIARDRIKRQWCKDNGVKLVAIPYFKRDVSKFERYLWGVWPRGYNRSYYE